MSFVAIVRATSVTTLPTLRVVKFRWSTPDDHFALVGLAYGKASYNSTEICIVIFVHCMWKGSGYVFAAASCLTAIGVWTVAMTGAGCGGAVPLREYNHANPASSRPLSVHFVVVLTMLCCLSFAVKLLQVFWVLVARGFATSPWIEAVASEAQVCEINEFLKIKCII